MKKQILWTAVIVVIILSAGLYLAIKTAPKNEKITEQSTREIISGLFSQKYNKPADAFLIQVGTDTGAFAKGSVNFTDAPGGGIWFAAKTANGWELAFDGNGIVPCEAANKYNFPKDMIPQCFDAQDGNKLITR